MADTEEGQAGRLEALAEFAAFGMAHSRDSLVERICSASISVRIAQRRLSDLCQEARDADMGELEIAALLLSARTDFDEERKAVGNG